MSSRPPSPGAGDALPCRRLRPQMTCGSAKGHSEHRHAAARASCRTPFPAPAQGLCPSHSAAPTRGRGVLMASVPEPRK